MACAAFSAEDTGTVQVIGEPDYTAQQIHRFHYEPKPLDWVSATEAAE